MQLALKASLHLLSILPYSHSAILCFKSSAFILNPLTAESITDDGASLYGFGFSGENTC